MNRLMSLFGYSIVRDEEDEVQTIIAPEQVDDGGISVTGGSQYGAMGGSYSLMMEMDQVTKNEAELVTKYRSIALQPEISAAVEEITNEAINVSDVDKVVEIILDDVEVPDKVKEYIQEEFDELLNLLDFSDNAYDIFSRWYIDGRLNYLVVIDEEHPSEGIKKLQYVDPRKIQLVREIEDSKIDKTSGAVIKSIKNEYYIYSDNAFAGKNNWGGGGNMGQSIKIAKDSVARVTSGLMDENNKFVLSYLHKTIKPLNQLRMLEDASVIYTLTRAPERRIFYVDVGNLPKAKAEQYLHDMMARHKNKLQYNSSTGEITDARRFMTMTEDFWFPRREGNRSTEVDQLAGGASLLDNGNLEYFNKRLQKATGVPLSRLETDSTFSFGRPSEITKEELKFAKFVRRLRTRFSILFDRLLEQQLVLKGIIAPEEWEDIKDAIRYDFMKDNYFEELKNAEILKERLSTLGEVTDYIGTYYSKDWVMRNVLQMSDDDIEEQQKQITKEREKDEIGTPGEEEQS